MKLILTRVGGFLIIMASLWGTFYTFHVWPIPAPYQWWYIPEMITAFGFGMVGIAIGAALINKK